MSTSTLLLGLAWMRARPISWPRRYSDMGLASCRGGALRRPDAHHGRRDERAAGGPPAAEAELPRTSAQNCEPEEPVVTMSGWWLSACARPPDPLWKPPIRNR